MIGKKTMIVISSGWRTKNKWKYCARPHENKPRMKKKTTTQWFCSTETNIKFQKWRIKKTLPSGAESTRAYHKSLCIYHRYHKNHVQTFVAGGARTHYAVPARLMTTLAHSRVSRLVKRFPQQMFKKSPIFSTKIGQRFPNGGFGERKRRDILKVAILPC